MTRAEDAVLRWLATHPKGKPFTVSKIAVGTGLNMKVVSAALVALRGRGEVDIAPSPPPDESTPVTPENVHDLLAALIRRQGNDR